MFALGVWTKKSVNKATCAIASVNRMPSNQVIFLSQEMWGIIYSCETAVLLKQNNPFK